MSSPLRKYWRQSQDETQDKKLTTSDSDNSVSSNTIPSAVEVRLDSSECSLEPGSVSETSFDADSEMMSTSDSDLDVAIFNTNAKWIASLSKLEISSLQSHDRTIVENTNVQNLNEYGVQVTKNMEWNDYCSKLDISMFHACDMDMVAGGTTHTHQIQLPSTNNTIKYANMEWIDYCSKLDISTLQAYDMDMVLNNRCVKESDDTDSKDMKCIHANMAWIDYCSKLDISTLQACDMDMVLNNRWIDNCSKLDISTLQACDMEMVLNNRCVNKNDDTDSNDMKCIPATTSLPKINLKILLCLFLLIVMANTRVLSISKSFSSTKNNIQKVCSNMEIEVRKTKEEVEHVAKVRRGLIVRNIIPTMPGDGVVHF